MTKIEASTRELILKAAEEMFACRGFHNTTISDISSSVGISESTIYEHLKNKKDILFSIPLEKVRQLIELNERHLRGLVGARVKLRKLVWNYFEFLVNNPNLSNLLLFELRPNRFFYETEIFEKVLTLYRPFEDSIIEGQNSGEFRPSLDPDLLLNLIFGTIDHILITWLIKGRPDDPHQYLELFFNLLDSTTVMKKPGPAIDDKRRKILEAAASIFSKMGFNKARIQDIAKLAGVGDGTIYQYFKNKEEILFSLPIDHTRDLILIHGEHFRDIKDSELRLIVLVNDYLNFLELHKEYSSLVLLELRYNRRFYQAPAYDLFREFARIFYDIIKDGTARGHFRQDLNPYIAVKMIFGTIDHSLLSWLMFGKPENLVTLSEPLCQLFLSALKP